jgi:hypothetical protein
MRVVEGHIVHGARVAAQDAVVLDAGRCSITRRDRIVVELDHIVRADGREQLMRAACPFDARRQ